MIVDRLNQCNLKIKMKSIEDLKIGHSEMRCLGHRLSSDGIAIDPPKLKAIMDWPKPVTGDQLQSYLGFVNFIRQHVRYAADVFGPLEAVKNEKTIEWTPELSAYFELSKEAVAVAPLLQFPDWTRPFHVATDASSTGIGGVLYQPSPGTDEITATNIVSICSKKLSSSQRNYSAYKVELWALVYCLRQFHSFIWGRLDVVVHTDHKPLTYILTSADLSHALQQWLDVILDYRFKIFHREGKFNIIPDILSRMYFSDPAEKLPALSVWGIFPSQASSSSVDHYPIPCPSDFLGIRAFTTVPSDSPTSSSSLGEGSAPIAGYTPTHNGVVERTMEWIRKLGIAMEERGKRIPATEEEKKELIYKAHALGHFGRQAMFDYIYKTLNCWWPDLRKQIAEEIAECNDCAGFTVVRAGFNPPQTITATRPGDHWQFDNSVHLPPSPDGFTTLLVAIDVFTGFVVLRAMKDTSAESVAHGMVDVFKTFGLPKIIQTDNGPEFSNACIRALTRLLGIAHRLISAYNPRADGKVERVIGSVMSIIKKLLHGTSHNWPLFVPFAQMCFNNKINSLTSSNPFALMYGRNMNDFLDYSTTPPTPIDLSTDMEVWQQSQIKMNSIIYPSIVSRVQKGKDAMIDQMKKYKTIVSEMGYPNGATVFIIDVKKENKFQPKYVGPYTIIKRTQRGNYLLRDGNGDFLDRHVPPDQLKLISKKPRKQDLVRTHEVAAVMDHRGDVNAREYRVRWKGYGEEADTWESEQNFHDTQTITRYWKFLKDKQTASLQSTEQSPSPPTIGRTPLTNLRNKSGRKKQKEQFVVEEILSHRGAGGKLEFLVKWEGYGSELNSWEPLKSFQGTDMVEKYFKKQSNIPSNEPLLLDPSPPMAVTSISS